MFIVSVFGMDGAADKLDRDFSRRSEAVACFNVWTGLVRDGVAKSVCVTDCQTGEVLFDSAK